MPSRALPDALSDRKSSGFDRERFTFWWSQASPVVAADAGKPPRPPRRREEPTMERGVDVPVVVVEAPSPRVVVARSSTMPKDSRLAGWFRKKKRVWK